MVSELPRLGLPAVLSIDTRHAERSRRGSWTWAFACSIWRFHSTCFRPSSTRQVRRGFLHLERQRLLAGFDAIVVMHSRGTPANMRELTDYDGDLCDTVCAELSLAARMLTDDSPSLCSASFTTPAGFAKTAEQSLTLLRSTERRKRSLSVHFGRLFAQVAVGCADWTAGRFQADSVADWGRGGGAGGASIVRVHDVAETKLAL